jgi:FtsP/CotA-like multicopper oxidase with cupredoxin domain
MREAGITMRNRRVLRGTRRGLTATAVATALGVAGLTALTAAPAHAATPSFDLWAETGSAVMPGGQAVTVWGYRGTDTAATEPGGPTLRVAVGDEVTITLHNRVGEPSGLLVQGQSMVPDLTGVPAGDTTTYTFTADRPGTFLYEAAPLPNAQHQTAMGLYGALVVDPAAAGQAYPAAETAYDADNVLLLGELDPALNNAANPSAFDMRNYKPRYFLVNGHAYPDTATISAAGGSTRLLRYVNGGLTYHSMGVLGTGQTMIALDGAPLRDPRHYVAETIGPGQTADALIDVPDATTLDTDVTVYDAALGLHNSNTGGVGGMLTSLQVAGVSAPGDTTGPVVHGATVASDVLTATADDGNGHGGSTVQAVEYYLDSTTGSPAAMAAVDGSFDTAAEDVTANVSLGSGDHVLYVRGQDAAGNWGPFTSALVSGADQGGPVTLEPQLKPNVVKATNSSPVDLSATADDSASGNSAVAAAEYFIDSQGPDGTGTATAVSPPGASVASLDATIPPATLDALPEGSHAIFVHAQDAQGNWGEAVTVNLTVDETGPLTTGLSASPTPNNGAQPYNSSVQGVRVIATTMTDPISSGVNSAITDAEAFLDTVGTNGTGIRLTPSNGTFTGTTEGGYTDIPLSTVVALANGDHTISVHAKDAAGNWGPFTTTTLTVDKTRPGLSGLSASPNPTLGSSTVTLSGTATDPAPVPTGIKRAEWWRGTDPGAGNATPMTVSGSGPSATVSATIDVSDFGDGVTTLKVRVQDLAGNWSTISSTALAVRSPIYFSTLGNTNPPGVAGTADDSDLYLWSGLTHSRSADLSLAPYSVPTSANVDGLTRVDGSHFYLSFAADTTLPGVGAVQDEDVVYWNGSGWSVYFNGTAHGLTNANLDLDAISVNGSTLYFSTLGNTNPPGVGGTADDADIYSWNGTSYARVWDASANGVPAAANVDGYDRVDGTHFYLSFTADTSVTGTGTVQDEDVVYVDGAVRSVYFDGTAHGLTNASHDVDAFDVP